MIQILELVRERFGASVPQAPSPQDFAPLLPEEDSDEGAVQQSEIREPVGDSVNGLTIIIAYRDAKGSASLRQISCIRIETGQGKRYLRAFCHQRRAQRVFLMTRIEAVHDAETGEELACGNEYFAPFADDQISASPLGWGLSPVQRTDLGAGLTALIFLSRCDGHVDAAENDEIDTFTASWWIRAEIRAPFPEVDIQAHIRRMAPDAEAFVIAAQRIRESDALRPIVAGYAKRVIEADGRIAPEEHHWIERYIDWMTN
jgi:hypothetical protein